MEGSNRPLRVRLKVVEIWSGIPVGDAIQNAQMQFQRLLNLVEDPSHTGRFGASRRLFDFAIRQRIDVQFRPHKLESLS